MPPGLSIMNQTSSPSRRHPTLRKAVVWALQALVLGLLAWYVYQNRAGLSALRHVSWQQIAWIILLDSASFFVGAWINYSMIRRLDAQVGFLDCLMLQYVNNLLNKILPTIGGGAAFRAYYLKKKYNFPYTQFASTIAGLYVISFSMTALIGLGCLLAIYLHWGIFNVVIALAFLAILLPTTAVMLFSPRIPPSQNRLLTLLKNVVDSWNVIKQEPRLVLGYMALSGLLLLIAAAYSYVGYAALGLRPGAIPMLYLSTLGIILAFVNFTPDGIGVKEAVYVFSKDLVQIPQDLLVLGSLYLRGISIVTTAIVGAISYAVLMRRLKQPAAQADESGPHKIS
jgi:uncharacterized protein (TIRG00374 family)